MRIHICMRCHGVLYGYPETTRYCYACKASTMMPVNIADYNFDYPRNTSNAYRTDHIFHDYVEDRSSQIRYSSEKNPRKKSTGRNSAKTRRKRLTLGMGVRAFLTGKPLRI